LQISFSWKNFRIRLMLKNEPKIYPKCHQDYGFRSPTFCDNSR
jgi:hypothetical protein